jgi:hypothetical protein
VALDLASRKVLWTITLPNAPCPPVVWPLPTGSASRSRASRQW